ncbi:MAG TPA: alpha/beta hydrolase, partial [Bacillota bacterium]|nr:alpha/beta hydrolase [Bacillota bacterium]
CRNNPRANPNRVGLMGFSMGGNSVYKFISGTIPDYIKAAVVYSATPCWSAVLQKMATAHDMGQEITTELISWVESIEPYHTIGRLRDFPLLMVNGARDEIFPVQGVRDCYQELYPNYNDKQRLVQLEYPQAGHHVADEMLNPAIEWFQRFLK